ncbi:MAG: hypothetical protein RR842_06295 [Gordonibacter sp.]|uniref:hypothetical protein n=1 Tax=Gordonibacter sp. TaxID=1968902 RepID=UPI002FC8C185
MKKQISVAEDDGCFNFLVDDVTSFSIEKGSLVVDSKKLYEAFFRNLEAKPEYEVIVLDDASRECKYVAGEFKKIIDQTLEKVAESWFEGPEK